MFRWVKFNVQVNCTLSTNKKAVSELVHPYKLWILQARDRRFLYQGSIDLRFGKIEEIVPNISLI